MLLLPSHRGSRHGTSTMRHSEGWDMLNFCYFFTSVSPFSLLLFLSSLQSITVHVLTLFLPLYLPFFCCCCFFFVMQSVAIVVDPFFLPLYSFSFLFTLVFLLVSLLLFLSSLQSIAFDPDFLALIPFGG